MTATRISILMLVCATAGVACDRQANVNLVTTGEQCLRRIGIGATAPGEARVYQGCTGYEERFLLAIPPRCTTAGCGLIADIPGATAPAENPNLNTGLRQRTRDLAQPFLVLSADRPSLTFNQASSNRIFSFMQAIANVFNVDRDRIHIGGFSNGGSVTFDFVCDPFKAAFIASAAPQASANPLGRPICFGTDQLNPNVPILYFSGRNDMIATFSTQQQTAARIRQGIGAANVAPIVVQQSPIGNVQHLRFVGTQGRILETIQYDNIKDPAAGPPNLGGHCYVGPFAPNGGGCTGPAAFQNGAKTLEFYLANPKRR